VHAGDEVEPTGREREEEEHVDPVQPGRLDREEIKAHEPDACSYTNDPLASASEGAASGLGERRVAFPTKSDTASHRAAAELLGGAEKKRRTSRLD